VVSAGWPWLDGHQFQGADQEGVHQDADREGGEDALVNAAAGLPPDHQGEDAERACKDEPG